MSNSPRKSPMQIAQDSIGRLRTLLYECDRLEVISRVAAYILSACPDIVEPESPDKNEAHLEYLVSMATALDPANAARLPSPDEIQEVIDLLTELHIAASAHHMLQKRATKDDQ